MTHAEPVRPFENTKTAKYINEQIERLKSVKSQRDIALEAGYEKPNVLSMIKRGETRLPLDKVAALATAMDVDPARLMRMALEDYLPKLVEAFQSAMGHLATQNEWQGLLKPWREVTQESDPPLTAERSAALDRFLKEIQFGVEQINPENKRLFGVTVDKSRST